MYSYMALFPNHAELTPTDYRFNDTLVEDPCDLGNGSLALNPSARVMPVDKYMFMEFDGFDEYTQADGSHRVYRPSPLTFKKYLKTI